MNVTGKGSEVREEDLPIDVQYHKLTDWLVDRKRSPSDWKDSLPAVRAKVNAALSDMPDIPEITAMLTGTYLTPYHARRILRILQADTSEGKKSLFGYYSSKRTADWDAVVRAYESGGIHLAECAEILRVNVAYEHPALMTALRRCQKATGDCERRSAESLRVAKEYEERHAKALAAVGVDPAHAPASEEAVRSALRATVADLPSLLDAAAAAMGGTAGQVAAGIAHYAKFAALVSAEGHAFPRDGAIAVPPSDGGEAMLLPALSLLLTHGNVTVGWERRRRAGDADPGAKEDKRPQTVEAGNGAGSGGNGKDDKNTGGDEAAAGGIDWGDLDGGGGGGGDDGGIDWGVVAEGGDGGDGGDGGIDWGVVEEEVGDNAGDDAGGIDWGVVDDGAGAGGDDAAAAAAAGFEIEVVGSGAEACESTACLFRLPETTSRDYESLLECAVTRNAIVDELIELRFFLMGRLDETRGLLAPGKKGGGGGGGKGGGKGGGDAAGGAVQGISQFDESEAMLERCLAACESALAELTTSRVRQLIAIASGEKYVARLARSIDQHRRTAIKLRRQSKEMDARREASIKEAEEIRPKIEAVVAQTREIKAEIETDLSALYNGRKVNIVGEINQVIAA